MALARRYGLAPYRRRGQHRRTIMVKAPPRFIMEVLNLRELAQTLYEQLAAVTTDIISSAVHADTTDAPETAEPRGQLTQREG